MDPNLVLAASGAGAAAFVVGWWLRGTRTQTERRILEELYSRKVKLAEEDREQAVDELNHNLVQVRDWQGEIERVSNTISEVQGAATKAGEKNVELEQSLAGRVQEYEAVNAQLNETRAMAESDHLAVDEQRAQLAGQEDQLAHQAQRILELEGRNSQLEVLPPQLTEAIDERARTQEEYDAAKQSWERESAEESGALNATIAKERERVAKQQVRIAELEGAMGVRGEEVQQRVDERNTLERELRDREAVERARVDQLERSQAQLEEARAQAERVKRELQERREELKGLKKRFAALSASHKATQLKVQGLAAAVHDAEAAVESRDGDLRGRKAELREALQALKVAERRARKAEAPPGKRQASPGARTAPADPLQEIAGIGPATEARLRSLGYGSFKKLANLDHGGVDSLADKLGVKATRIRRERWVGTAKRKLR